MEENEKIETNIEETNSQPTPAPKPDNTRVDEDAASAEEMEAYARQAAERRANKKAKKEEEDAIDYSQKDPSDAMEDPYLEPDPTLPWVKFEESVFLSRGCNHCPESYVPVSQSEINSCAKVTATNWLQGVRQPGGEPFDIVEVRFKHNRKDYFRLPEGLEVSEGDLVAVEGQPGHDIGLVSLTGEVCRLQMQYKKVDPNSENIKKLFRRAKPADIEKWHQTLDEEHEALIKTRRIAENLGLVMKVNDVEIQGDRGKAIFYYTADDRVDFRELIKVLAEEFHLRIEMKQIGVRQEASKIGGIGTCGRELCCSTWLTNFKSVTTAAAKTQQILPNPQKLAGQCGKLKCCLNFEYAVYADALKTFPPANSAIRFQKGLALYKKTDVFRGIMWYAYEGENDLHAIPAEKVKEIIEMNHNQQYPERLEDFQVELMSTAALAQETSNAEFEQELRRLAEGGNGVVTEEKKERRGGDRRDDHERQGERRDRQDRRDRQERQERRERRDRQDGRSDRKDAHQRQDNPERRENRDRRSGEQRRDPQDRMDRQPRAQAPEAANVENRERGERNRDRRSGNRHRNNRPKNE